MARGLVGALGDHCADRVPTKPRANPWVTVAFVSGEAPGTAAGAAPGLGNPHRVHQRFELRRFVSLARRCFDGERQASAVSNQVQFRAESAS